MIEFMNQRPKNVPLSWNRIPKLCSVQCCGSTDALESDGVASNAAETT